VLLEADRRSETAEPGTDHEDADVGGKRGRGHDAEHTDGIERASIALLKLVQ
jgi:hypothetical protein